MYELIVLTSFFVVMLVIKMSKLNKLLIQELELRDEKINTLESDLRHEKTKGYINVCQRQNER